MIEEYKLNNLSPERKLDEVDNQIAETNRYLAYLKEELVPDPRAIEIVRSVKEYSKGRCVPVKEYILPENDVNELTKLLARGIREKDLTYEGTIKDDIEDKVMPQNYNEALQKAGYFFMVCKL